MTRKRKNHAWPGLDIVSRILLYFVIFTTLTTGVMNHRVFSRQYEIKSLVKKRLENESHGYQVSYHKDNKISNWNESIRSWFDRMVKWMLNDHVGKGGASHEGKSLRFRLGERFAFRKRLQFALLPIMYKMGVMTTLLTGLTILVLKGLTIGIILLIFAFGNYFSKLHKHSYQSQQPIHVHVHSQDGHKVPSYPSVVGPWDREADEVHPGAFLTDGELESYRKRLIQNSAAMENETEIRGDYLHL